MSHLQETGFRCDGDAVHGATLHQVVLQGNSRHAAMAMQVWHEATVGIQDEVPRQHLPVLLLSASPSCHGLSPSDAQACLSALLNMGMGLHPASQVLPLGKAGIVQVLRKCAELLDGRSGFARCPYVVVIGLDSLLTANAISRLHAQSRLKLPDQSDGLIPGEAAAALLIGLHAAADDLAVWIDGVGHGHDTAAWTAEGPPDAMQAQGLVAAIREACAMAKTEVSDLDFHVSGVTGESWQFREVAMAMSRATTRRMEDFDHRPIAGDVGEVGAAAPVLALAWLSRAMRLPPHRTPGRHALLHMGNDSGERSALILRARTP